MRDRPVVPRLRQRSPVHGLRRRGLGPLEVLAQSVSGAAPSAAMAATPAIVAVSAGGATVWSFVAATVLALLIAGCIARFTRRMAAPGGLYTLTAKGLSPGAAFACGVALLVGYGMLAAAALVGGATYLQALVLRLGGTGSVVLPVVAVVVVGLAAGGLALRGVRLSARVVLLAELVSITLMLAIFVLLLAAPLPGPDAAQPGPGLGGVAAGVLPALAAFIGFEVATSLGAEARRPFRSVPRAVTATAVVSGLLCVFAAQTQVVGFAAAPGGLAGQNAPVAVLATARGWPWVAPLLDLGLTMSFFACVLATVNGIARVLFSLGRDGVAPRGFGRTHPRFATPHVAIGVVAPVLVVVLAVALLAGAPLGGTLTFLLTVGTGGFLVAYLLVCLAAPVFLRRIGELTWPAVAATAVIVPILVAVLVAFVARSGGTPVVVVLAALAVAGACWFGWLRLRRPDRIAGIGVYDETVADDVLGADVVGAGVPGGGDGPGTGGPGTGGPGTDGPGTGGSRGPDARPDRAA
ncbi:APC family permease [Pseudonocardia benzenivorans]|uniref:APC family permease n=2 Tax=Pseudonocardia TaxID=1847 RepID=A0ABW3VMQ5_9PSEU